MEEVNQNRKLSKLAFIISVLVGILLISDSREENKAEGWKTYRDKGQHFEIKYPSKLIRISRDSQRLIMLHSLPFEHIDPCDMDDIPSPPLKELTDFNVSIEVVDKNLKETIIQGEIGLVTEIPDGAEIKIGSLTGYKISTGNHGCGWYRYYFPLDSTHTLFVERSYIPELNPLIYPRGYEEYLKLPGSISHENEGQLFNQILSTFKFFK